MSNRSTNKRRMYTGKEKREIRHIPRSSPEEVVVVWV